VSTTCGKWSLSLSSCFQQLRDLTLSLSHRLPTTSTCMRSLHRSLSSIDQIKLEVLPRLVRQLSLFFSLSMPITSQRVLTKRFSIYGTASCPSLPLVSPHTQRPRIEVVVHTTDYPQLLRALRSPMTTLSLLVIDQQLGLRGSPGLKLGSSSSQLDLAC